MIYSFRNQKTGENCEKWFRMSDAPSIGSTIDIEGVPHTRLPESPELLTEDVNRKHPKYPYVSHALPRGLDGCKCDETGKPIVKSKRHEREIMAQHGYERQEP